MNRIKIISAAALLVLALQISSAAAGIDFKMLGGVGFPGGLFDYSANLTSRFTLRTSFPIEPELNYTMSIATNITGGGSGNLTMFTSGLRLLARYETAVPRVEFVKPFIAVGGGTYLLQSYASSGVLGNMSKTVVSSKAHVLFGTDIFLSEKSFLSFSGRTTYPSDIVLDLFTVSFGYDF